MKEKIIKTLESFEFWDSTENGYNSTLWILNNNIDNVINELTKLTGICEYCIKDIFKNYLIEDSYFGLHRCFFEDIANDILINLK